MHERTRDSTFRVQVTAKKDVIEAKEPTAKVGEDKAVGLKAVLEKAEAVRHDIDQRASFDLSLGRARLGVMAVLLYGYLSPCVTLYGYLSPCVTS